MRRPPSPPPILRTPLADDILGDNTYVPPEIPDDQRTGRDAALKNPAQATVLFNRNNVFGFELRELDPDDMERDIEPSFSESAEYSDDGAMAVPPEALNAGDDDGGEGTSGADAVEDGSDGNSEDPATPDEPETTPETPEPTTDDQPPATPTPAAPKEKAPLEPLVPLGDDDLADVFARLPDDMRAMFLDLEDAGATPFVRDATLDTPATVNVVEVAFPPPPVPPKSEADLAADATRRSKAEAARRGVDVKREQLRLKLETATGRSREKIEAKLRKLDAREAKEAEKAAKAEEKRRAKEEAAAAAAAAAQAQAVADAQARAEAEAARVAAEAALLRATTWGPGTNLGHNELGDLEIYIEFSHPPAAVGGDGALAWTPAINPAPLHAGTWAIDADNENRMVYRAPGNAWELSTKYEVTVAVDGVESARGEALAAPVQFNFRTPRLSVVDVYPGSGATVAPTAAGVVVFDQAVDAATVLEHMSVTHGHNKVVEVERVAHDAEGLSAGIVRLLDACDDPETMAVVFRPVQPVPYDAYVTIRIPSGTPGRVGNLGTIDAASSQFEIWQEFKFRGLSWNVTNINLVVSRNLRLEFNTVLSDPELPADQAQAPTWRPTLTPAPPGEWVYDVTQHNGRVLDYVLNDGETWPRSTEFTVTLAAGDDVTSGVGTPLLESVEARISTETIAVVSVDPLWQPAGDASRLCVASPILVRFTQAIDRAAVVPFLVIQESGWISNTETPLVLMSDEELDEIEEEIPAYVRTPETAGTWLAVRPSRPLNNDVTAEFKVKADVPSAEGPLTDAHCRYSTRWQTVVAFEIAGARTTDLNGTGSFSMESTHPIPQEGGSPFWVPVINPPIDGDWTANDTSITFAPVAPWPLSSSFVVTFEADDDDDEQVSLWHEKVPADWSLEVTTRLNTLTEVFIPYAAFAGGNRAATSVPSRPLIFVQTAQPTQPATTVTMLSLVEPGMIRNTSHTLRLVPKAAVVLTADGGSPPWLEAGAAGGLDDGDDTWFVVTVDDPLPASTTLRLDLANNLGSTAGPLTNPNSAVRVELTTLPLFEVTNSVMGGPGLAPIRMAFSHQLARVGGDEDDAQAPLWTPAVTNAATEAPVPGDWVLEADGQTLIFTPAEAWALSSTFRVAVGTDVTSKVGETLRAPFDDTFSTATNTVEAAEVDNNAFDGVHSRTPRLLVTLAQPADPAAVADVVTFSYTSGMLSSRTTVAAVVTPHDDAHAVVPFLDALAQRADRSVVVQPVEPLPYSKEIRIDVGPQLPSTLGPLLGSDFRRLTIRTCDPFVARMGNCAPMGAIENGDLSDAILFSFSHPLPALDEMMWRPVVDPPVPGLVWDVTTSGFRGRHTAAVAAADGDDDDAGEAPRPFARSTVYTVALPDNAEIVSTLGEPLQEATRSAPYHFTFSTPTITVAATFPSDPKALRSRDACMFLAFDQEVDPPAVLQALSLHVGSSRNPSGELVLVEENPEDPEVGIPGDALAGHARGHYVIFRAAERLPAESKITVKWAGLPSAEGPELGVVDGKFSFKTVPPFCVSTFEEPHFPVGRRLGLVRSGLMAGLVIGTSAAADAGVENFVQHADDHRPSLLVRVSQPLDTRRAAKREWNFRFAPPIEGDWAVVDDGFGLAFTPSVSWRNATAYQLTMTNVVSVIGERLPSYTADFESPRPAIVRVHPEPNSLLGSRTPLMVQFSQEVNPADVVKLISVSALLKGKSKPKSFSSAVALTVDDARAREIELSETALEMMENPRTVAFVLKKALPYDATLYIQFGPKIPSLEGSLKTTEPFQFTWRTVTKFEARITPPNDTYTTPLEVTFTHPLFPIGAEDGTFGDLGWEPEAGPADAWPDGEWVLTEPNTLTYVVDERWFGSNTFRVAIPAGIRSGLGETMAKGVEATFDTPLVSVVQVAPYAGSLVMPKARFVIVFNQEVDPEAVLRTAKVFIGPETRNWIGRKKTRPETPLELVYVDQLRDSIVPIDVDFDAIEGKWAAVSPVDPLPNGEVVDLTVGPGITSSEGPRTNSETYSYRFTVVDALKCVSNRFFASASAPPTVAYNSTETLYFSNELYKPSFDRAGTLVLMATGRDGGAGNEDAPEEVIELRYHLRHSWHTSEVTIRNIRPLQWTNKDITVRGTLAGLHDVYGQALEGETDLAFKLACPTFQWSLTCDLAGKVVTCDPLHADFDAPTLRVSVRNIRQIRVLIYELEPEEHLQRWIDSDFAPANNKAAADLMGFGEVLSDAVIELPNAHCFGAERSYDIDISAGITNADLGTGQVGVVVVPTAAAIWPNDPSALSYFQPIRVWMQFTRLGLGVLASVNEAVVWATDMKAGTPVPNLSFRWSSMDARDTVADDNGDLFARLPLKAGTAESILFARRHDGSDAAFFIDTFGGQHPTVTHKYVWHAFDDRGLYRPGTSARVKGWVRIASLGADDKFETLAAPEPQPINFVFADARGVQLATGDATLNRYGGFDVELSLPENMNLGGATVTFTLPDEAEKDNVAEAPEYVYTLRVEEFRRIEFEAVVECLVPKPLAIGQDLILQVKAAYLTGGRMADCRVDWTVNTSRTNYTPPGLSSYTFGLSSDADRMPELDITRSLTGATSEKGFNYVKVFFTGTRMAKSTPITLRASAEVLDINQQAVVSDQALTLHPCAAYVGLRARSGFAVQGEDLNLELVVADIDGNPIRDATVSVKTAAGVMVGTYTSQIPCTKFTHAVGPYDNEVSLVAKCTYEGGDCETAFKIDAKPRAVVLDEVAPPPPPPSASTAGPSRSDAKKAAKAAAANSAALSIVREARVAGVKVDNLVIRTDMEEYEVGETAQVLITARYGGAGVVVVSTTNGVVATVPFEIDGPIGAVPLPIEAAWIPNVLVTVALSGQVDRDGVPEAGDEPDPRAEASRTRPAYGLGMAELSVSLDSRELSVTVEPEDEELEPGGETTVELTVTDAAGNPMANAEVVLLVADEAVLSLSGYKLKSFIKTFYPERALGGRRSNDEATFLAGLIDAGAFTAKTVFEPPVVVLSDSSESEPEPEPVPEPTPYYDYPEEEGDTAPYDELYNGNATFGAAWGGGGGGGGGFGAPGGGGGGFGAPRGGAPPLGYSSGELASSSALDEMSIMPSRSYLDDDEDLRLMSRGAAIDLAPPPELMRSRQAMPVSNMAMPSLAMPAPPMPSMSAGQGAMPPPMPAPMPVSAPAPARRSSSRGGARGGGARGPSRPMPKKKKSGGGMFSRSRSKKSAPMRESSMMSNDMAVMAPMPAKAAAYFDDAFLDDDDDEGDFDIFAGEEAEMMIEDFEIQAPYEPPPPPPPIAVRSNFDALAHYSASRTTDDQGRCAIRVQITDSLTRFRVMAVSAAADYGRFGLGESVIIGKLPLTVRCIPPRFLNYGDVCELTVVVSNTTRRSRPVSVGLRACSTVADLVVDAEAGTTARAVGLHGEVPRNGRRAFTFRVKTQSAGQAKFVVGCSSRSFGDASVVMFPVHPPATTQTYTLYGDAGEDTAFVQPIAKPNDAIRAFGGLSFAASSTALQSLTDSVLYIYNYNIDGVEQTASKLLTLASLGEVLFAMNLPGLPSPSTFNDVISAGLKRLKKLQKKDGSFSTFGAGGPSHPFVSAHVAHAVGVCKLRGHSIPSGIEKKLNKYLSTLTADLATMDDFADGDTVAVYALYAQFRLSGNASKDVRAIATAFYERMVPADLPVEVIAWLISILAEPEARSLLSRFMRGFGRRNADADAPAPGLVMAGELSRYLVEQAVVNEERTEARYDTHYGRDVAGFLFHTPARTDAVVLEALLGVDPEHDLVMQISRGLLTYRKDGRWQNTQDNAWVAVALNAFFRVYEKDEPSFVARTWLGGEYCGQMEFVGRSTDTQRVTVPMAYVLNGQEMGPGPDDAADAPPKTPLLIQKEGPGRLYYRVSLDVAPNDLTFEPVANGFVIERTFAAAVAEDVGDVEATGDHSYRVKSGTLVKVTVVVTTESARYNVAVIDKLCGGVEHPNPSKPPEEDPNASAPKPVASTSTFGAEAVNAWVEHENRRDERAEAFATRFAPGVFEYQYTVRATSAGEFLVPPARVEEMYTPELFGTSASDTMVIVGEM